MNKSLQTASLLVIGLMMLAASTVPSETLATSQATFAKASSVASYAQDVAQAMRRTETGALSLEDL